MKAVAFKSRFIWNGFAIKELTNIGFPQITTDTIDVTTHDSDDGFKEYLLGLKDVGEFNVDGFLEVTDTDGQLAMYNDYLNNVSRSASIELGTTGVELAFTAFLTSCSFGPLGVSDAIPFSASVKVTGKPTLTITTSTGLTDLVVTGATLVPAFATTKFDYIATAAASIESVKITPTGTGAIKVDGNIVATGVASGDIALGTVGSITDIKIEVKEIGKAPKVYKIKVARAAE